MPVSWTADGWSVVARDALDGVVEIEQQRALAVVADHALNPEERRDARAARHGRTECRLVEGYSTRWPAGSLTLWTP